ncbi:MAG: hypothetical protein WCS84_16945 [Nocardioides sp.]|jgi:hypothetical protein
MTILKAGSRLRSQVDSTELIVVRAPADDLDLLIGGHPAIEISGVPTAGLTAEPGEPALMGKRYTRAEGDLELLITKAGTTGLTIGATALHLKESKPLPASD